MRYSTSDKEAFIEKMKGRTKKFAVNIIHFCDKLPRTNSSRTISFQLVKSATSTGANYRAACRGRSKAEFHSKLSITVEEADESLYWLELIEDTKIPCDQIELKRLQKEIDEITRILAKARKTRVSN